MSAALRVVEPGLHSSIQDRGRPGFQKVGVPVSGALDPDSLAIANALVGNRLDEAALEVRYAGPTLEVMADSVLVAVAGTGHGLEIIEDKEVIRLVPPCQSVRVNNAQQIRLRQVDDTVTAYLAIAGGFDLAPILGSRSTYLRAGLGGFRGRLLRAEDMLPLPDPAAVAARSPLRLDPPDLTRPAAIRVIPGPQDDRFSAQTLAQFLDTDWRVTSHADRMGIRLEGPALAHLDSHDIVSDGITTGCIQVPGNGQPILLLNDRQTTGGYPKIATVISTDLPYLARLRSGDPLRFQAVEPAQAASARKAARAALTRLIDTMEPVKEVGLDLDALYRENLISGVFSDP